MQNLPVVIGIMGPGETAKPEDCYLANKIGKIVAQQGYLILTGGRNCGVMDAALKGAKEAGGITIGILPGNDISGMSRYVDIPIITGMGNARNNINILSSTIVVVIGESPGTHSEIALALKAEKHVLALNTSYEASQLFGRYSKKYFINCSNFEEKEFILLLNRLIHET